MELQPVELKLLSGDALSISWNDGQTRRYMLRELRDHCPCATCRQRRAEPPQPAPLLPVLSASDTRPLRIAGMQPVGHYAYAIEFSDGHNTGIYTLELLRELGTAVER